MDNEMIVERWQPIETAPKDGRRNVLICDATVHPDDFKSYVTIGLWTDKHAGHVADDEKIWADWNAGLDDFDMWSRVEFEPTHWMPVPGPPSS